MIDKLTRKENNSVVFIILYPTAKLILYAGVCSSIRKKEKRKKEGK